MKTPSRISSWVLVLMAVSGIATIAAVSATVEPPVDFAKASADMAAAAEALLGSLNPEQLARARFEMKTRPDPQDERLNWHFIPKDPDKERKGLTLKLMNPDQRKLALQLLATGLSAKGYEKATTIMSLEAILAEMEGAGRRFPRDPELYHVLVFGKPAAKGTWAWRFEGHHLSLSFTLVEGKAIAGAPAFMGSNPGIVKDGPRKGLRVLGNDEDLGRRLAKSLTAEQKEGIVDAKAPSDILLMPKKKVELLQPAGIAVSKLSAPQVDTLKAIVKEYAHRLRAELAEQDLEKIEAAGWDKVSFAWAGGLEPGEGHYYRIQGPSFILEYDNTQGNANHVHSVWHDPADNFGENLLRKHLQESHGK